MVSMVSSATFDKNLHNDVTTRLVARLFLREPGTHVKRVQLLLEPVVEERRRILQSCKGEWIDKPVSH